MAVLPEVLAGLALAVAAVQNAERDEDSPTEAAVAQQIPVPKQKMLQHAKSPRQVQFQLMTILVQKAEGNINRLGK